MATRLFTHLSYANNAPTLHFFGGDAPIERFNPRGKTFTLEFDTSSRFCTGWHDLRSSTTHPCPEQSNVIAPYHECRSCQQKTGFNPAFYHAQSISPQQRERNEQPHFLYLAHFAPGVVKVGISYAQRGIQRLLDQGARSFLSLKTFPTAESARQYEAQIARMPGIIETLQGRVKYDLLNKPYDHLAAHAELQNTRKSIQTQTDLEPDEHSPQTLDNYYLTSTLQTGQLINLQKEQAISGTCIGVIGDVVFMQQNDNHFFLPLSKFRGYRVQLDENERQNKFAPQQASLF